ncbi:uncharacterized protein LY89DRAFT_776812 [Mollisia scopiformis]|uniref:Uncharacterized protein n=1 Tax=Mollisia scopiformis TaxID=149040 RepID=A0A194XS60_MOLSC|nr:uncharacterized protein LY89DRAFT_776812 [Mollisia scopiformis]KUJ22981.1 hypothetical protein LY89DRAFT_776812 [Mollisia scopiformis]
MTGRQKTFELVPTTLVKQNASRPPMTSKAAKKAYQQAQRGTKISKAEQRRRDAAELERIRKEHEKERNAAKTKAARDKKATKALAEREARKKLGLPEPSRFVRASQPTISRFVRGDSNEKRSWQQMEDVEEEEEDEISDDDDNAGSIPKDKLQPPAKRVAVDHDSEDEFGDFPTLSQSALEKIDSSAASLRDGFSLPPSPEKKQNWDECKPYSLDASQEPPFKKKTEDRLLFEKENLAELVTTKLLSEAAEAASRSYASEPAALVQSAPILGPLKPANNELSPSPLNLNRCNTEGQNSKRVTETRNAPQSNSRPALLERSTNMPPPRLLLKKPSMSFATPPVKPLISRQNLNTVTSRSAPYMPPSSTQAFLENHLDDFFPSPSQQVRELLEDVDDIPSNTQIAQELGPQKPMINNRFEDLICTQDLVLTPQDLEEIITPSRAPPPKTARELKAGQPKFLLPPRPTSRDKPRFFQEKEEDLCQAALDASKIATCTGLKGQYSGEAFVPLTAQNAPNAQNAQNAQIAQIAPPAHQNPRARRFFEEKEEDILQAALHESKISAPKHVKSASSKGPPSLRKEQSATDYGDFDVGDFFEDEEQKMLEKAIGESKKLAGLETQKVLLKETPRPQQTKRTLKRVKSTATDYGDDEFSGCSQELLALC